MPPGRHGGRLPAAPISWSRSPASSASRPTESVDDALADHDVTLALTPGQLLLAVIGVYLLLRVIRGLRH